MFKLGGAHRLLKFFLCDSDDDFVLPFRVVAELWAASGVLHATSLPDAVKGLPSLSFVDTLYLLNERIKKGCRASFSGGRGNPLTPEGEHQ